MGRKKETMNYSHEKWEEFVNILSSLERCYHDYRHSEAAIKHISPNVDIEETKRFFRSKHGFCDCEVMFNVVFSEDKS